MAAPLSAVRRLFTPAPRKWPAWVFVNIVCGVVLAWYITINVAVSFWRIGVDPQDVRCLPWAYYLISQHKPDVIKVGTIYRFRTFGMAPTAKDGTPMVKYAAAVAGDSVRVDRTGIYINGTKWGGLNPEVMRKTHMTLERVTRSYTVPDGYVVMLGTLPRTFDARYTGPIPVSRIDGRALPLW